MTKNKAVARRDLASGTRGAPRFHQPRLRHEVSKNAEASNERGKQGDIRQLALPYPLDLTLRARVGVPYRRWIVRFSDAAPRQLLLSSEGERAWVECPPETATFVEEQESRPALLMSSIGAFSGYADAPRLAPPSEVIESGDMDSISHLRPRLSEAEFRAFYGGEKWQEVRRRYIADQGLLRCYVCAEENAQLHHRTYARWGGNERISDLVPLCEHHHREVHAVADNGDGIGWYLYDAHRAYRSSIFAKGLTAAEYRAEAAEESEALFAQKFNPVEPDEA